MQEINPIDYPELEDNPAQKFANESTDYLHLIGDVEVELSVQVGSTTLSIAQLNQLKVGQTLALEQKTDEPVEVKLNGKTIACGELVVSEDNFAIKITQLSQ